MGKVFDEVVNNFYYNIVVWKNVIKVLVVLIDGVLIDVVI